PAIDLPDTADPWVARLVPRHIAERRALIPVNKVGFTLTVAMADPLDVLALDDIQLMTGLRARAGVAPPAEIREALNRTYGALTELDEIFGDLEALRPPAPEDEPQITVNDAAVVRLAEALVRQAARAGATEVLLEPHEREFRV